MADQTPEVCETCGCPRFIADTTFTTHNMAVIGGTPVALCYGGCMHHDPPVPDHPFRPAEPTPAERPEGGWSPDTPGVVVWGESAVMWRRSSDGVGVRVPLSLKRAISSAAVAEAEDRWRIAEREVDRLRSILGRLRKRYERVSTVYQVREADNDIRRILSESFTPEDAAVNTRAEAAERALEEAREAVRDFIVAKDEPDEPEYWPHYVEADARLRALVSTEGEAQR